MKNNTKDSKSLKGIKMFSFLYILGILLVVEQFIEYSQWTIRLIKKWELPAEPFFSKIKLIGAEAELSITVYLIFALLYIFFLVFILIGLFRLNRTIKLFSEQKIFLHEVSSDLKKAGKLFLIYVIGTFAVDFFLLFAALTGRPVLELFTTETIVFVILSYFLFFMSDVLKEGILIKEENDLTI